MKRRACRISQIGVNGTGRRRHACRKGGEARGARLSRAYRRGLAQSRKRGYHPAPGGFPMPFLSGKQAFLQILKQEGVAAMVGTRGRTELPLMDGLVREPSIRYILALQEAVAISMADGYAQASGKLGVVNVHTSPGLGNAMGMLYDAHEAGTPLLITAGQHDPAMNLTEPILSSDLPPVARPYVKWSLEFTPIEDLPRAVRLAATYTLAHPTGPAFISLPVDVLNADRALDLLQS